MQTPKIHPAVYPLVAVAAIMFVYFNGDIDGLATVALVVSALGLSAAPSIAGK
jgi:hypothetical protein